MPKPLRASIMATVSIQMMVNDEDKLTDGVETLEDGIKYALGDELYRLNRLGEFSIEAESVDDIQILDHGTSPRSWPSAQAARCTAPSSRR